VEAAALFDYQTPRAFADYLREKLSSPETGEKEALSIPKELFEELKAFNMGWKGERRTANSLVVGCHSIGSLPPLFWCAQGASEVEVIVRYLDPDRPIYGMRSLYKVTVRSEAYNRLIAAYYADEICEIQAAGSIRLGGFCEGGKIACEVARQLQARGRDIEILILQEYYEPAVYEMDVVFLSAENTGRGPRFFFYRPDWGLPKLCRRRFAWIERAVSHYDFYAEPFAQQAVEMIDDALHGKILESAENPESGPASLDAPDGLELKARCPRILGLNESVSLPVWLKNTGTVAFEPSRLSGLSVGQRWTDRAGRQKGMVGQSVEVSRRLAPGDSVELTVQVTAPAKQCRRTLELSCVEEGVARLDAPACRRLRFKVDIFPAARNLNRIVQYRTGGY